MQRIHLDPLFAKPFCQLIGTHAGPHKYKNLPVLDCLQFAQQQIAFVDILCQQRPLTDSIHRLAGILDLNNLRICKKALGKLFHFGGHGCRKQNGLAGWRQGGKDTLDRRIEPKIDHLIALIENEMHDVLQLYRTARLQILQPARRCDNHIDALFQRAYLMVIALTTADNQIAQLQAGRQGFHTVGNLIGQFTRWRQDQRAGATRILCLPAFKQLMQKRQQKSGCLAGSGLRNADEVAPR